MKTNERITWVESMRKSAQSIESSIVTAMTSDGFEPPMRGDSRHVYMKKIADYIEHLRGRSNDLEPRSKN